MNENSHTSTSEELLRATAEYLRRLPKVPATAELIRKIDAQLSEGAELLRNKSWAEAREGVVVTPTGLVLFSVRVEGDSISVLAPISSRLAPTQLCEFGSDEVGPYDEVEYRSGSVDFVKMFDVARMKILHKGISLDLRPAKFPSGHSIYMEQSLEHARACEGIRASEPSKGSNMAEGQKSEADNKGFKRGFFCAVAVLLREEGAATTAVKSLFSQCGSPLDADAEDIALFKEHGLM